MADDFYATSARVTVIRGSAGTGKTESLANRVVQMVAAGEDAARIALFAATPAACDTLRARVSDALAAAELPTDPLPQVLTAFECEMALLSLPEACHALNREPRIMLRFEENIFMEDMKTCGVAPKRLGEMIRFFYRSCSDLESITSSWFYNSEEEKAFRLLGQLQDYYGCYVRQLVPYHAYRFAKDFPRVTAAHGFAHVLVDDYQLLTKASQCLLGLLSEQTLTVTGDRLAAFTALEEFPYPAGLDEVRAENPDSAVFDLVGMYATPAVQTPLAALALDACKTTAEATALAEAAAAAAAIASSEPNPAPAPADAVPAPEGGVGYLVAAPETVPEPEPACKAAVRTFGRPAEELSGVATLVADLINAGVPAASIAVAAPKPVWEGNVTKALRAADIPVSGLVRTNVSGDVRTLASCYEGRVITLLRLLEDPTNQLALRCWCGFGDYLANSALFTDMAKAHAHLELGTTDITMTAGENALFAQQRDRTLAALEEARDLLPRLQGYTGEALVRRAAHLVDPGSEPSPRFLRAFGPLVAGMDAGEVLASLERTVFLPRFAGDADGVRVALTTDFAGLRPRAMILTGMVNGLTPESRYFDPTSVERDKRPAMLAKEQAKVYAAAGKANETLLFTAFTTVPLLESEQLRLKVERVRLRAGERVCEVHPSETIRAISGVRFDG